MRKPLRDRGVYRAAANAKSPIHKWALKLVNGLNTLSGIMAWVYRDKGDFSLAALIYDSNPFFSLIPKKEMRNK